MRDVVLSNLATLLFVILVTMRLERARVHGLTGSLPTVHIPLSFAPWCCLVGGMLVWSGALLGWVAHAAHDTLTVQEAVNAQMLDAVERLPEIVRDFTGVDWFAFSE